ncbi:hypothetical protein HanRHA438_Chr07g0311891 [Helianthus annuus]|nr:hypothetical protein HanRHA438_Chr07g0311891 [Helianthus annuus]
MAAMVAPAAAVAVAGGGGDGHVQDTCNRTFGEKCRHIAKKQRAKFYIVRRCIAMLVCWHDKEK